MKYEKEINGLLREFLLEESMTEEEFQETIQELGASYKNLILDIEEGVKNGHSVEEQINIARFALKQIFRRN